MHELAVSGQLIAATNKHHLAGMAAIAVGAILVVLGLLRLAGRVAIGAIVPILGIAIVLIGVLTYTRVF